MKDILVLEKNLRQRLAMARIELDAPADTSGFWFLNVADETRLVVVTWRQAEGFSISSNTLAGYGTGGDEIVATAKQAEKRVLALLRDGVKTRAPLRKMRECIGVSQRDIAKKLLVSQANISKFESRPDVKMSKLVTYVDALGGEVEFRAKIPGVGVVVISPQPCWSKARPSYVVIVDNDSVGKLLNRKHELAPVKTGTNIVSFRKVSVVEQRSLLSDD